MKMIERAVHLDLVVHTKAPYSDDVEIIEEGLKR